MEKEIRELANRCFWKLRTLLRSRRFFSEAQLVGQYKAHVLPFVEHSTPAVYHAAETLLSVLDRLQVTFLRRIGLTEEEALLRYNLAPLSTRRDIAMLGLVHRTTLGEGPPQFQYWFRPAASSGSKPCTRSSTSSERHGKQLHDYLDGSHSELLRRTALGLSRV